MKKSNKRIGWVVLAAVLLFLSGVLAACDEEETRDTLATAGEKAAEVGEEALDQGAAIAAEVATAAVERLPDDSEPALSPIPVEEVTATPIPAPTGTTTAPGQLTATEPPADQPDIPDLLAYMVTLINAEREARGLQPLAWDPVAAEAGRAHASAMIRGGYFSHWSASGYGPDWRYQQAGGEHAVQENLYAVSSTYETGEPAPFESWRQVIETAHEALMESPGHQANILNPAHTHVGIGLAYDPDTGQMRLAQEFTNQYVALQQALPEQVQLGDRVVVRGTVPEQVANVLLSLDYEPFPEPLDLDSLNRSEVWQSPTVEVETWAVEPSFSHEIDLEGDLPPGLYHVRIFGDVNGSQALLLDHILTLE